MYRLELAQPEDFSRCMEILRTGRDFQRAQGFVQWSDSFPQAEIIREDIQSKNGYVLKAGDAIAAYLFIGFEEDPAYPKIRGAWHHHGPYAVIHRIAIAQEFRGMGLSGTVFRLVADFALSRGVSVLRIDTHEDNKRMQHVLATNGFAYCGLVLQGGSDRLAYDRKLTNE